MNKIDPQPGGTKTEEFSEVLRRYGNMAYRMALHLTRGQEAEARDLVQEGFIKIWRFWPLQRPTSFQGWMYRVLHNLYMDTLRRRARRPTQSLDATGPDQTSSWEEHLADPRPEAHENMEQRELQKNVSRALQLLDEEFRVPIVLCDMEGLSYEEIARVMSCPVGTVRSRIHRGRQQLRKSLKVYQPLGGTQP